MDPNKEKSNRSPHNKPHKKTHFITQMENDRNIRISQLQESKKQLSYSTFLESREVHIPFTMASGQLARKQGELSPRNQEVIANQFQLLRARSLKLVEDHKPNVQTEKSSNELGENRLKAEEMALKYKTKISSILKEINISSNQMVRFNNIAKIDEILNFLTLKVKQRIVKSHITEQNFIMTRPKPKDTIKDFQIQREILLKKMEDRDNIEQELKNQLDQIKVQAADLLNKVSEKDKQLTFKTDQLHTQKITLEQQQKLISRLQQTCDSLEKQSKENIKKFNTESQQNKNLSTANRKLELQNSQLAAIMDEFKIQIQRYKEKQKHLESINKQLNDEICLWRQRFEDGLSSIRGKQQSEANQGSRISGGSMKKSTFSMSMNGFTKNQQIDSRRFSSFSTQIDNMRYKFEIENQYKKKMEEVIKDWKNKLYELVHKYEDQLQTLKEQIDKLQFEKEQMGKKLLSLSTQKIQVEAKLLEKEREIQDISKISSTSHTYQHSSRRQQNQSHSMVLSQLQTKPRVLSETTQIQNFHSELKKPGILGSN